MKKYIILFVIIAILGGMFGYFFFKTPTNTQSEFIQVSTSDATVLKLYEMANPSDNISTMESVYKKLSFSNEFILGASLVSYIKETKNIGETISEAAVFHQVRKIFGNVTFAHNSGYIASDELCAFQYDAIKKEYTYVKGCEGNTATKLIRKIVKAEKSESEYIITEKMIITTNNQEELKEEETTATLKVYNDINQSKLLDEITYFIGNEPKINLNDYLESAATYQYHFVFDGENFVYQSIEKVG